jgi:membrane dipeptidase
VDGSAVAADRDLGRVASALHSRAIVIDTRDPTFLVYRQMPDEKPAYWDSLEGGGVTAVLVDVPWIDDDFKSGAINAASWLERIEANSERAMLVRTIEDIRAAKAAGKAGIILSAQTPTIVEDSLPLLRVWHALGLRVIQMSYQARNLLADGIGESRDGGVSDFGRAAITEMNRLGIAIDLSHASDRTMTDTIEHSSRPVFFSHSNARSRVAHRRNVPDETLRQLSDKGGVCSVSAYSDFLADNGSATGTTLDQFAQMIRYVANIVGIDHVGFGLDTGEGRTRAEIDFLGGVIGGGTDVSKRYAVGSRSQLPDFTAALLREGFTEAETEKILGLNLVRFFGDVWA